ncbi:MAG: histidine utilization repressor [Pseudomonadales bacterium]|nr:histidine utilization repressor [Pseudomonadales bacterium]
MGKPRYTRIKEHIIRRIDTSRWKAGDRVPSENALATEFGVSRMTARRALQELGEEGLLVRTQGLGSFVADARPMSSMLTVRSIDEEITARGHQHRAEVLLLEAVPAERTNALLLGLGEGAEIFHSILLHWENTLPLQYEERFVNPRFGPEYLSQDFTVTTPSHYLSSISPLTEADQSIEAVTVDSEIGRALQIKRGEPCLKLNRRTWCQRGIVNISTLIYPGSRYRIGGHLNF